MRVIPTEPMGFIPAKCAVSGFSGEESIHICYPIGYTAQEGKIVAHLRSPRPENIFQIHEKTEYYLGGTKTGILHYFLGNYNIP